MLTSPQSATISCVDLHLCRLQPSSTIVDSNVLIRLPPSTKIQHSDTDSNRRGKNLGTGQRLLNHTSGRSPSADGCNVELDRLNIKDGTRVWFEAICSLRGGSYLVMSKGPGLFGHVMLLWLMVFVLPVKRRSTDADDYRACGRPSSYGASRCLKLVGPALHVRLWLGHEVSVIWKTEGPRTWLSPNALTLLELMLALTV